MANNIETLNVETLRQKAIEFCGKTAHCYVDGIWIPGKGEKQFTIVNPANEKALGSYETASAKVVDEAVVAAQRCFNNKSWCNRSMRERARTLRAIGQVARQHRAELAAIESLVNGKTFKEAYEDDLPDCADIFDYYAGWVDKHSGELVPTEPGFVNFTTRDPWGVCALIAPWNFPLLLACWKIAPALAAGNSVIIKPSEYTPLSMVRFLELVTTQVDLPRGLINLVLGDGKVGDVLAKHPSIHKVSFTGSTAVGRKIVESSGTSNLKAVTLELGGKSPVIFFEDAPDFEKSLQQSIKAMFSHKGEKCSEPTRFVVHKRLYNSALEQMEAYCSKIRCGDPFAPDSDQGPQCNSMQYQKILSYFQIANAENLRCVVGGKRDSSQSQGYFVRPSVYETSDLKSRLVQEEIFGPVATVTAFESEDDAIVVANATRYGLAAGLWTQNLSRALRVSKALDAGMVFVNRYGCYDFTSPFGGCKESGWGKEMARESMDAYTKSKSIWLQYDRE